MSDDFDDETMTSQVPVSIQEILLPERIRSLRIVKGPDLPDAAGRHIPLGDESLTIGRSRRADVRLDAPSLSRLHARFYHQNHEQIVEDLDSRNGLFLNGIRVSSAILRDGDLVQIGHVILEYRDNAN